MNHNAIGRGYETFGNGTAETLVQSLLPEDTVARMVPRIAAAQWQVLLVGAGQRQLQRDGALAALDYAARQSQMLLQRFLPKGLHSWRKGLEEPPYAFIIPKDQGDPTRVAQMVGRLMAQHIEVSRSEAPFSLEEGTFPAGTYVVRLDQPYRNYAVDLLTPQMYPKEPASRTTTFLGNSPPTIICRRSRPPTRRSATRSSPRSPRRRGRRATWRATARCIF